MTSRVLIALERAVRNGTPDHLLRAGRRVGFLHHRLELNRPPHWETKRLLWNALSPLRMEGPGGYSVRRQSLEELWRDAEPPDSVSEWLSNFPLLPPPSSTELPVSYYIDATLQQNYRDYGYRVGNRTRKAALYLEKEGYDAAVRIVCYSKWCADNVTNEYGITPDKVSVINPGANLDEALIPPPVQWDGHFSPLRLGLIGVDWRRKGLGRLLDAADLLSKRGHPVEVTVIGPDPAVLPRHPSLRPMGFINKTTGMRQYIELVRTFHFGCLLSTIDTLGISLTECLRLGIPVIATDVGGVREQIPSAAGLVVPLGEAANRLADELDLIITEPERYAALRAAAARSAPDFTWERAVNQFERLFDAGIA